MRKLLSGAELVNFEDGVVYNFAHVQCELIRFQRSSSHLANCSHMLPGAGSII